MQKHLDKDALKTVTLISSQENSPHKKLSSFCGTFSCKAQSSPCVRFSSCEYHLWWRLHCIFHFPEAFIWLHHHISEKHSKDEGESKYKALYRLPFNAHFPFDVCVWCCAVQRRQIRRSRLWMSLSPRVGAALHSISDILFAVCLDVLPLCLLFELQRFITALCLQTSLGFKGHSQHQKNKKKHAEKDILLLLQVNIRFWASFSYYPIS